MAGRQEPAAAPAGTKVGWECLPCVAADVPDLARLCETLFPSAWNETSLHAELQSPDAAIWLARSVDAGSQALAGFVLVRRVLDEVHIHAVGVCAGFRRRGVAATLLERVLAHAREDGLAIVHLEQRASNHASHALYEAQGFVVVGRRPRYYRDGEDALLMSLALAPSS